MMDDAKRFFLLQIIDDWVLMGFLVGNDFIPNIPNLHINSNALPMLYEAYVKTMTTLDGYINEGGFLNLARLQAYIENLAKFDREHFSSQYDDLKFLESKHQGAYNDRNTDTFGGNQELKDLVKATDFEFGELPPESDDDDDDDSNSLEDEKSFEKEFHQHRRDYYVNKMKYEEMTPEVLAEQAECYIRALQWTLSYYYHGVQSWSWYYPHHYAPYISDLRDFKDFDIRFEMSAPFLPFQQLMSVLPAGSRAHVPECYKKLMTSPDSELIDFYPTNFETDLNGKKQEWEAVVLIPFIDEQRLLKTLDKHNSELSPDEKARNVHGPMYVYTYAATSQGSLEAPYSFPSIGNVMCHEKMVFREEIQVPKEKLVLGPSKGSMLNVYFTGFPTFKHLNYKSQLRRQNVKVFDQPSRGDNMIIVVETGAELESQLKDVAKDLLSKSIFVGWPHLVEGKVVEVSDKDETFFAAGATCDKTDPQKWRNDVQTIRDHHSSRMGIDVGEVHRVVRIVQTTGEEYQFDQKSKIFRLNRTYERHPIAYPLQCIVQNIKAYRRKFKPEVPLIDAFKNGTEVFMLTNPYYGAFGEVVDVNCHEKNGRVKVMLTVPQEPDFSSVQNLHDKTQGSYMNSYQTSAALSISENVFNRITGTVLVIAGSKRHISSEGTPKINIGLQLKFPKANEELAGFSKKDRIWLYSDKVIRVVQDYYCKFPVVFEVLGRSPKNGNDIYFESDFFDTTHGEENLQSLLKWLATLPHQKAERRQIGTESVEKEVLAAITDTVNRVKESALKKITMQVKPHLLHAPALTLTTAKAPDTTADYKLFDRVVVARESEKFAVGMKGTVIAINRVKDLNPVRQECVNKEDVYCEVLFDNPAGEPTGRLQIQNLVNISYGESLTQTTSSNVRAEPTNRSRYQQNEKKPAHVKPQQPPPITASYSAILRNPEKKPDAAKQNNFADMWNALKEGKPHPEAVKKVATDDVTNALSKVQLGNKQMPIITAPTTLPAPPLEWLAKPQQMKPELEMPQPPPPAFFQPQLPPFNNNGFASYGNNPFQPGVFFPSNQNVSWKQFLNVSNFLKIQFQVRPVVQHPQPQQQRFFHNANNFNGFDGMQNHPNNFNYMNNFNNNNNANRFKAPPHYQHQPRPAQVQQQPAAATNPFIPLQASRKATKAKNLPSMTKTSSVPRSADDQQKEVKARVEPIPAKPIAAVQTEAANKSASTKRPAADNRKSRLAISFGGN